MSRQGPSPESYDHKFLIFGPAARSSHEHSAVLILSDLPPNRFPVLFNSTVPQVRDPLLGELTWVSLHPETRRM